MLQWLEQVGWSFVAGTPIKLWIGCFIVGMAIEFVFRRAQPECKYGLNCRYMIIYLVILFLFAPVLYTYTTIIIQSAGGGHLINLNFFNSSSIPQQTATFLITFFIGDFFYYWYHRTQHAFAPLWDQHEVHHSDMGLNVTTGIRQHWSEFILQGFFIAVPSGLLFKMPPSPSTGILWAIFSSWSFFIHLNVRLPLGSWAWLIAGPQYHRIHHSVLPEHQNRNFAAYFPILDVLFGTYYAPTRDEYPNVGLYSGEKIDSVWMAAIWPFKRWFRRLQALALKYS